ncbi:(d)CMP kinase [Alkaliphilus oremlandii]|uniref:Cytidylate kinase n=1 Tax=Alkaliphilus oremlandii (strain OhILAs) TaxID=350688 RepID=KCY_ALKOO|nr:(d)CMP kinase [Alkaliphilus oremlandii]A8MFE4.1 RecName: Full=Cytidylate kinase; Short=CK; AltName: Full=Cytidine monophosphate kinase; Short=CMP kinase [Alkaliphilus oremlandii OhILAs]ABW19107.1 cytidylate kinase [Alkaliphilus oremlandii OhILAs]
MEFVQIAIDGPAGAGKSTIAKRIAERLNITYIDTGAMYRALTYKVLANNIDITNEKTIIELAQNSNIQFLQENIYLDGKMINEEIRSIEINKKVSHVAKIKEVREILVDAQRKIALGQDVIMDGRDIGTHVLPNATLKIFLTASVQERALRRYLELKKKGIEVDIDELEKDIMNRDNIDSQRAFAPLVKAQDAIIIDTTGLTIEDVVERIINLLKGV